VILPYCLPYGKAGGHQIRCCQGFAVNNYNFTLDALTLKPYGFCNPGVKLFLRIEIDKTGWVRLIMKGSRDPGIEGSRVAESYQRKAVSQSPSVLASQHTRITIGSSDMFKYYSGI